MLIFAFHPIGLHAQGAYFFDGQDDFIKAIADPPQSSFNGEGFTIEAVFQIEDLLPEQVIVSQSQTVSGQPFNIGVFGNGNPYVKANGQTYTAENVFLEPGICYHLSIVFTFEEILFYLNGSLVDALYHLVPLPELSDTSSFYFGMHYPNEQTSFFGRMEEMRIFTNQRTSTEISNYLFKNLDIANDYKFATYSFGDNLAGLETTDPYFYYHNTGFLGGESHFSSSIPRFTTQSCMMEEPESIGSPFCSSFQWSCNAATVTNPAEMLCNGDFEQYCSALNNPPSWAEAPHAFNAVGSQGITGSDVVNWEQDSINAILTGQNQLTNSSPDFYVKEGLGTNGTGFNLRLGSGTLGLKNPPTNTHNGNGNAFMGLLGLNRDNPIRFYQERARTLLKNGQNLTPGTKYTFSGWFYKANIGIPPYNHTNDSGSVKVYFTDASGSNSYFADSVVIPDATHISTNNGWVFDSVSFITPSSLPGNLQYMVIEASMTLSDRKAYIYLDDLSLIEGNTYTINPTNQFPQYVYTGSQNDFFNRKIKVDANNNIFTSIAIVNGPVSGEIGITNPQTFATAPQDMADFATLIVKYDDNGLLQWSKLLPNIFVTDFDFTSGDDLFVVGYTQGAEFKGSMVCDSKPGGTWPYSPGDYYNGSHINFKGSFSTTFYCGNSSFCFDQTLVPPGSGSIMRPTIDNRYNENIYVGTLQNSNGNLTLSEAYGHTGEEKALGVQVVGNTAYISADITHSSDMIMYNSCSSGIAKNRTFNWGTNPLGNNGQNALLKFDLTNQSPNGVVTGFTPEQTKLMAKNGNNIYFVDYSGSSYTLKRYNTVTSAISSVALGSVEARDLHVNSNGDIYLTTGNGITNTISRYEETPSGLSLDVSANKPNIPYAVSGNSQSTFVFYLKTASTPSPSPVLSIEKIDPSTANFGTALWQKETAGQFMLFSDLKSISHSELLDAATLHNSSDKTAFIGNIITRDANWQLILDNKILQGSSTTPSLDNGHVIVSTIKDLGSTGKFKKGSEKPIADQPNEWSIFPNPTNGLLNISGTSTIKEIQVTDLSGRVIITKSYIDRKAVLDLGHLEKGIYVVYVNSLKGTYREKILLD